MCCSEYKFCLYVVVFTIVESVLHLSFCSWALKYYYCRFKSNRQFRMSFTHFWWLTYVYSKDCLNPILVPQLPSHIRNNRLLISEYFENRIIFPDESESRDRFGIIFNTYVVLDTVWIVAAIILLIGIILKPKGPCAFIFFVPWSFICICEVFLDSMCTILTWNNIPQTYTMRNWFKFVGFDEKDSSECALEILDIVMDNFYSASPAIFMFIMFSRFIVGWLINIGLMFPIIYIMMKRYRMFVGSKGIYCAQI